MNIDEGRRRWTELCERWEEVHQAALLKRAQVTGQMFQFQAGNGVGAQTSDLARADELEAEATNLRAQMDAVVRAVFKD